MMRITDIIITGLPTHLSAAGMSSHCPPLSSVLVLSKMKRAAITTDVEKKTCDDSVSLDRRLATDGDNDRGRVYRVPAVMPVNDMKRDRRSSNSYSGRNNPCI